MEHYFGKETPKLGFGLMRLPKKGLLIDLEQTKQMVDLFLEEGFTYFDTAFVYPGSESAAKKVLVSRHPRESYTLATKLHVTAAPTEKLAKQQFETSLKRTGAEYFDYYLLHALTEDNYKRYGDYGIWDFAAQKKEQGLIRHVGFSFHGGPRLLDRLLTKHPEVEFVQLQINYVDWENPLVASRANYEVARRHGKSIVVMEPVKGGTLANPPESVQALFRNCAPEPSPASWAIRFAASLEGILTVLSGMSNIDQMRDNISYMRDFHPLVEEERLAIQKAQRIMESSKVIPCTSCRYCVEGCPKEIPIPDIFTAMNKRLGNGQISEAEACYRAAVEGKGRASDCIACKKCESICPQHIPVVERLKECTKLEG